MYKDCNYRYIWSLSNGKKFPLKVISQIGYICLQESRVPQRKQETLSSHSELLIRHFLRLPETNCEAFSLWSSWPSNMKINPYSCLIFLETNRQIMVPIFLESYFVIDEKISNSEKGSFQSNCVIFWQIFVSTWSKNIRLNTQIDRCRRRLWSWSGIPSHMEQQ